MPWLSVSAGGTTPGAFSVALTSAASGLAASDNPYSASIVVACVPPLPCAANPQTLNVSLLVKATPPKLTLSNDSLAFSTSSATPAVTSQSLGLQNTGGGTIGVASVSCSASWCKLAGVPASILAGTSASVTVSADPTGLGAGFYWSSVKVVTSAGTSAVPVTFFIAANGSISLAPAGVQFIAPAGGPLSTGTSSFLVTISGQVPVAWTAAVVGATPWLTVTTASGTSSGTQPGAVNFAVDPTALAALLPGSYYGTIRVSSSGAVNSPQDFQVVLNVTPATAPLKPNPAPAGLLFLSSATAASPPQTVQLYASSKTPVAYQASASTVDGGSWLSVNPAQGSTSAASVAQSSVTSIRPALHPVSIREVSATPTRRRRCEAST